MLLLLNRKAGRDRHTDRERNRWKIDRRKIWTRQTDRKDEKQTDRNTNKYIISRLDLASQKPKIELFQKNFCFLWPPHDNYQNQELVDLTRVPMLKDTHTHTHAHTHTHFATLNWQTAIWATSKPKLHTSSYTNKKMTKELFLRTGNKHN